MASESNGVEESQFQHRASASKPGGNKETRNYQSLKEKGHTAVPGGHSAPGPANTFITTGGTLKCCLLAFSVA